MIKIFSRMPSSPLQCAFEIPLFTEKYHCVDFKSKQLIKQVSGGFASV